MLGIIMNWINNRGRKKMNTQAVTEVTEAPAVAPSPYPKRKVLEKNERLATNFDADGKSLVTISPEVTSSCLSGTYGYYMARDSLGRPRVSVKFQDQPLDKGITGLTNEAAIDMLLDRFAGFQNGPFPNEFNERAIAGLEMAKQAMLDRVADRNARNVRGTHDEPKAE